jgi:hypothetical protein
MKNATNFLLIFVASAFSTYQCANLLWMGRQSMHWPIVSGQVTISQSYGTEGKRGGLKLDLGYQYLAYGQVYTASRFGYAQDAPRGSDAQAFIAAHPVGTPIRVHVDPANPENAVLEPGPAFSWLYFILMLLSLFFAVASAISYRRARAD